MQILQIAISWRPVGDNPTSFMCMVYVSRLPFYKDAAINLINSRIVEDVEMEPTLLDAPSTFSTAQLLCSSVKNWKPYIYVITNGE